MFIQILFSLFIVFALSRVIVQVRSAKISINSFVFWSILFLLGLLGVLDPNLTTKIAKMLGIGRGTDVILYISIALIFYLIFRLSIAIEETRREITEVVKQIALSDKKSPKKKPRRKST